MSKLHDLLDDIRLGKKSPVKHMSSAKIIALGYLIIIFIGAVLLSLPVASKGTPPTFLDSVFTATSATCVTGLVVFDTYTQWSVFGQIVIILLIQTGGMGFMTIISLTAMATGRKIGLKERSVLQDSVNNGQIGGIVRLMKKIALGTFIIEGIGTLLFMTRFIPEMGIAEGIWNSVFLSISAFCNAGFDLNGKYGEYCSLVPFADDVIVNFTASFLILTGGIGFAVWDDIAQHKWHISSYRLHSKIVLVMTAGLTVVGAILFFLFELDYTIREMSVSDGVLASLFSAVTPRTAGFNTVDTAALSPASKLLTIMYMFVGGSPGSTAGGVKTVTVAVLFLSAVAEMKNNYDVNVFGRRLEEDVPAKALTVIVINLSLAFAAIIAITAIQPELGLTDITFEAFSAVNTVGMTTGITRELNALSRMIIILLMYSGRVGSVSFALIFTRTKKYTGVHNPVEQVSIG